MQHFKQKFLPVALQDLWITNAIRRQDQAEVTLRDDDILHIPFARTNFTYNLPLTSFPRLWVEFLDEGIKILLDKIQFNSKLKFYFLEKLSSQITCDRLLCPDCHLNPPIILNEQ
jgi:hypothetical protein